MRTGALAFIAALAMGVSGCASPSNVPAQSTGRAHSPIPSQAPPASAPASPSPQESQDLTASSVRPESVTFISPDVGFVLGLSLCSSAPCLRLLLTRNAGTTWSSVFGAPIAMGRESASWHVRFADATNGWVYGPLLFATHDGARSWDEIALRGLGSTLGRVGALEVADGRVDAEVAEGRDADTGGPVVLFSSPLQADKWGAVSNVETGAEGYPGDISAADGSVWVTLHPATSNTQGLVTQSTMFRSADGVTWQSQPVPCPAGSVASVATVTAKRVLVVCAGGVAAGSQQKIAYLSADDGATYRRVTDPPVGGDFSSVAASPTAFAVAASSGSSEIYISRDSGLTWTTALALTDGGLGLSDLGFTTSLQGVVIDGDVGDSQSLELFMTFDGGRTWTTVDTAVH